MDGPADVRLGHPVFHHYYDPVPADLRPAFVARTPW